MVIFCAITMVVFVIAGMELMLSTHWATRDATDPQFYTVLAIFGIGTPFVWTALTVSLLILRGQTGGQYVAGTRLVREDGARIRPAQAAAWWFCFNPLFFSWPMALVAGLPLAAVISLALSRATIVVFGVFVTLCIVSPLLTLVSAILDGQTRALHDRVVDVIAVPAG